MLSQAVSGEIIKKHRFIRAAGFLATAIIAIILTGADMAESKKGFGGGSKTHSSAAPDHVTPSKTPHADSATVESPKPASSTHSDISHGHDDETASSSSSWSISSFFRRMFGGSSHDEESAPPPPDSPIPTLPAETTKTIPASIPEPVAPITPSSTPSAPNKALTLPDDAETAIPEPEQKPVEPEKVKKCKAGQKISLEFHNTDVANMVKTMEELTGATIKITRKNANKITVDMKDIVCEQALDTMLRQCGFDFSRNGNIVTVDTIDFTDPQKAWESRKNSTGKCYLSTGGYYKTVKDGVLSISDKPPR